MDEEFDVAGDEEFAPYSPPERKDFIQYHYDEITQQCVCLYFPDIGNVIITYESSNGKPAVPIFQFDFKVTQSHVRIIDAFGNDRTIS